MRDAAFRLLMKYTGPGIEEKAIFILLHRYRNLKNMITLVSSQTSLNHDFLATEVCIKYFRVK